MRLVVLVPPGHDPEAMAAAAWGCAQGLAVRTVALDGEAPAAIAPGEIPWCHAGAAIPRLSAPWRESLAAWVREGGRLLLTLLAAPLAAALGAPGPHPLVDGPRPWRDGDDPLWPDAFRDWPDYPHIRGFQGWGAHPLFDGLGRGTYTWRAVEGERVVRCTFRRPGWPAGRVVAVERAYVALDADEAVAWSYDIGAGHLLCLGANIALAGAATDLVPQRDHLLLNALALLDRHRAWCIPPEATWPSRAEGANEWAAVASLDTGGGTGAIEPPALAPLSHVGASPLVMTGAARADAPFTLAGRRALVVGDEGRGVQEIWLHPLCVLSEGVELRVDEADVVPLEVRVTPQSIVRTVADGAGRRWREVVAVAPDTARVQYDLAPLDPAPQAVATLTASMRVRLQWPMPADALQPLAVRQRRDGARGVVCVGSRAGPMEVRLAVDGLGALDSGGDGASVRVALRACPGGGLRLAVTGDADGAAALAPAWRAVRDEPLDALLGRLARHDAHRAAATVQLTTPDERLDVAFEWAKARLAAFVVAVPGVGTGLTAGYAASRPGWGDARPGYGWFFGRDTCWSGDALLAAGLFDEARLALEFLAGTADVTGKIAHEVTTTGVRHYDAADATPLWLRFVARYAEWTGDLATVRALHGAIVRGVAFVRATDRDGDGLPDNAGVGHGWIESGPLGGGAVTAYTAAIWIDALRRLRPVAARLGDATLVSALDDARERAERGFERRLRAPVTGRVYLQRRRLPPRAPGAGPPHLAHDAGRAPADADVADDDLTALSAVPILLGVDRHPSADDVVTRLGEEDFAAPWGVRLLSRRDARYRPRGYHVGAVWPLYTGWASLASFARARPDLGWRHLCAVAEAAFHRERGAFDEVLDGDTGAAAGICPDQAWSAAMVVTPFVEGALGLRPAATDGYCRLAPQWPAAWTDARVRGLRVGRSRFSMTMRRDGGRRHYTFTLDEGAPLELRLAGDGDAPGRLVPGGTVTVTRADGAGGDVGR